MFRHKYFAGKLGVGFMLDNIEVRLKEDKDWVKRINAPIENIKEQLADKGYDPKLVDETAHMLKSILMDYASDHNKVTIEQYMDDHQALFKIYNTKPETERFILVNNIQSRSETILAKHVVQRTEYPCGSIGLYS